MPGGRSVGASRVVCGVLAVVGTLGVPAGRSTGAAFAADDPAKLEFFEKSVRPVLVARCHDCHGAKKQEGGLRLDARTAILKGGGSGPAVVPGDAEKSELISAVRYEADGFQMPPTGKLKADEIAVLERWVREGAVWPAEVIDPAPAPSGEGPIDLVARADHWSFKEVRDPVPPDVRDAARVRSPIDRFVLAPLEARGLNPAPPADKRTWLRRITFDLIGLPPTRAELAAFLADESPEAEARVVDRLLASPRYGERWARHWLDLVRYAETLGHEFDFDIDHAWRYRDYVVRALNEDLPYDRFVVEHVAGDLLPDPRRRTGTGTNESLLATGFWFFAQGKHSPVDIRAEECDRIDNQLDVLGKTFLGLTIACARCHDHKFDPIRAEDYYALAGFLQGTRQQVAVIDPPERSLLPARRVTEFLERERAVPIAATVGRLQAATADFAARTANDTLAVEPTWSKRLEAAKNDLRDPLQPWAALGAIADKAKFATQRAALAMRYRQALEQAVPKPGSVFESFAGPLSPGRWFPSGPAFDVDPTTAPTPQFRPDPQQPLAALWPQGTLATGRASGRLQGSLRSKTFTVEKSALWYRVCRTGPRNAPNRLFKNGQISVVVDGFQIIRSPLWGGLSVNVPGTPRPTWIRQDVKPFLGRQVYIEFEDDDDGALVIDEIRHADETPLDPPNPLVAQLLGDETIDSPAALARRMRTLWDESLDAWRTGRLATLPADERDARAALVDALLERNWAASQPGPVPAELTAWADEFKRREQEIAPPTLALAAADGSGEDEFLLVRGNPHKPGPRVPRRFLEVFAGRTPFDPRRAPRDPDEDDGSDGADAPQAARAPDGPDPGSGRLVLARQLVDPTNPLAARVIVNRVWQHHFGRGLVPSSDNFGRLGQPPTHPELLDWLATDFVRHGWSLKALHRRIVLSSTYAASSDLLDAQAETADPQDVTWRRRAIRRLEAEAVRDALLALSGRLDSRFEGPSVLPHLTPHMEGRGRPNRSGPLDGDGRRSLYLAVRRNFLVPMFLAFDFPTPMTTMGLRSTSNVPAQSLTLMNNPFVVQQVRTWAERTLREVPGDDEARIVRLYEEAYARPPTADETAWARAFLAAGRSESANLPAQQIEPAVWTDLCHVLVNVKEFVWVR